MRTVRDILAAKGRDILSVGPEATLLEALELMAARNIGAVLVLGASGDLEGIFSERDFARKIIIKGSSMESTKVREAMTARVFSVGPDTAVSECMALMTERRVRHLPVMEGGKPAGIVSIGDVVKELLGEQELLINRQAAELGQLGRFTDGCL